MLHPTSPPWRAPASPQTRTPPTHLLVFSSQDGASAASNFVGALLNSIVFVLAVAFMTFLLALCFKHGVKQG